MNSVYNYDDPIKYISDYISFQKENVENFSLRKWSKELGFSSPITLIDIINKKKKLKGKTSKLLINGLGIDNSERMFLQAIIEKSLTLDEEKVRMYDLLIADLRPYGSANYSCFRDSESLNLFSHWIYMAIFSMTNLENLPLTAQGIKEALLFDIEIEFLEDVLFTLFEQGLLVKDDSGKFVSKYSSYSSKTDLTTDQVIEFYKMICDLAKSALALDLPSDEREFQTFTVAIPKSSLPLAKEIIRKARSQLVSLGNQVNVENDTVYQGSLYFFPLTAN